MSVPVPACRCGFTPCAIDRDAAINALWQHIEDAHGESVTDPRAAEIGVCLACAKNEHPRCSGSASHPCHCIHPGHDISLKQTSEMGHLGNFAWLNGAELVWECDDDMTNQPRINPDVVKRVDEAAQHWAAKHAHELPDRIAIDANGYGWRVWNDSDMWSMVPTNANNDPVPEPVTWFVPEAQLERIAKAFGVGEVFITGDRKAELLDAILGDAENLLYAYESGQKVEQRMVRLEALGDFVDRLHDEAFPDDPYLLGRLHAEMERLGYRDALNAGDAP